MSSQNQEAAADAATTSQFLGAYKDSNEYAEHVLRAVLQATKAGNEMPSSGEDFEYYSSFASFRQVMLSEGKDILKLMSSLASQQSGKGKFEGLDLEEKFDLLTDVNDMVLERVGNHLDEADGIKKKPEDVVVMTVSASRPIHTSWNKKLSKDAKSSQFHLMAARNVVRPQLTFREKVDNSHSPFVPIIRYKPHSIRPLAVLLENDAGRESYCHPYECEIEHFEATEEQLDLKEQTAPLPLEETPYSFVETVEQLQQMCTDLGKQTEIAVDLEHHSYRTFQGFTCLMQISTRSSDYVVDTLALRHELHLLNEVFANPKIIKASYVLHGADMDVLWLQRDFGLYLVGLFDTGQAARVLGMAHLSLAFLLRHYCRLETDKKFQLADWRIRQAPPPPLDSLLTHLFSATSGFPSSGPLPQEMIKYAREDTHYLLHVYDLMRRDLLNKGNQLNNLLHSVFQRSKQICLKRYEKPLYTEDSYLELYRKSKKAFNTKQLYALRHLYSWRDRISRLEDESTGYVLPNHMILQISEILPREQQGIVACCNPCPPLVRQNLNELHAIILKARDTPLGQKNEAMDVPFEPAQTDIDLDSVLHSVHDRLHHQDAALSLPTLLDDTGKLSDDAMLKPAERASWKTAPILTAFMNDAKVSRRPISVQSARSETSLVLPYERYKAALKQGGVQEATPEGQETALTDEERLNRASFLQDSVNAVVAADSTQATSKAAVDDNEGVEPQASFEDTELANPLRPQKPSRRKRKKMAAAPDVGLQPTEAEHVAKKPKRPRAPAEVEEVGEEEAAEGASQQDFHPFDYASAEQKPQPQKKQGKKWTFNPDQHEEMKGGKKKGKKQQFKSQTFGSRGGASKGQGGKRPKR
ncbi:unnamed protein product [Ixodes hexagonus]